MKPWKRIEPTTVQKVGYRTIVTKTYELPTGDVATFDVMHPEGQEFVNVIALTPEDEVVVVRMFRFGPEVVMDELPGGFVDKGETPEQAIYRELLEETGYKAKGLQYLGSIYKDVFMHGVWHTFLATGCKPHKREKPKELEEQIEVCLITIEQLLENARSGKMTDSGAVLLAYEELQNRRAQA